jgi:hypothetical protein
MKLISMKKIFLMLCSLLTITTIARAQNEERQDIPDVIRKHELSVSGIGGYSSINYTLSDAGSRSAGIGGGAGLGYTFNVNPSLGIVLGVEMLTYSAEASFAKVENEYSEGKDLELFQFWYSSENYRETQNVTLFSIPVMAQYSLPLGSGSTRFYASGGFKFGFPVSATADITSGNVTATGYYGREQVKYKDLPKHGFITNKSLPNVKENLDLGFSASLSLETGARFTLTDKIGLYTGLYFDYGLNNIRKTDDKSLMEYNSVSETILMHSVLDTKFTDKINLMSIGLKVRVGFKL